MSYFAPISFKTIREGELYGFFKKIKDTLKEKFNEIAENNFIFMPSINTCNHRIFDGASDRAKEEADRAWMRNSVFSYRFFYIPEHNLLGVFSIPNAVKDIFDLTAEFQNSCDQDYEFEYWKGVPYFEFIAEKWKNASESEVEEYCNNRYSWEFDKDECLDYDYYRRSNAYDEIWRMFEQYLYNEEDVVYISMFGGYEIAEQKGFVKKCKDAHEKREREFEEEYKKREGAE